MDRSIWAFTASLPTPDAATHLTATEIGLSAYVGDIVVIGTFLVTLATMIARDWSQPAGEAK